MKTLISYTPKDILKETEIDLIKRYSDECLVLSRKDVPNIGVQTEFTQAIECFKPDVFINIVEGSNEVPPHTIRKADCYKVLFSADMRPYHLKERQATRGDIGIYDLFVAFSCCYPRPYQKIFKELGIESEVYWMSNSPHIIEPPPFVCHKNRDIDISFVGQRGRWPRAPKRAAGRALIEAGLKPILYGNDWDTEFGPRHHPDFSASGKNRLARDLIQPLYRRTKIVFESQPDDYYNDKNYYYEKTLNKRTLDIMMAGALCISNAGTAIRLLFEEGKEFVPYSTFDELVEKVRHYLAHEEEREEIAWCGYDKVKQNYTLDKITLALMLFVRSRLWNGTIRETNETRAGS